METVETGFNHNARYHTIIRRNRDVFLEVPYRRFRLPTYNEEIKGYISTACKEYRISERLLATFIVAEAYDSLSSAKGKFEYWEFVNLYIGTKHQHDKRSVGLGQLRQFEVVDYRINNVLIEQEGRLAKMSNEQLVQDYEGNIYLMAHKIRHLLDQTKDLSDILITDMNKDGIKNPETHFMRPAHTWSEAQVQWFAMVYNGNNWKDASMGDVYGRVVYNTWIYLSSYYPH